MNPTSLRRPRLSAAAARQLLAEARRSGWSVSEAARRAGLPYTTLHAWERKLAAPARPIRKQKRSFVEVHAPAAGAAPATLELQTPCGFTLRLTPGFASADLQRILEALRAS